MDVAADRPPILQRVAPHAGQPNRSQGVTKTKAKTQTQHKVGLSLGGVMVEYDPNILYDIY